MNIKMMHYTLFGIILTTLVACGGSSGSDPVMQPPSGGNPPLTTYTVIGTITGFGSVYVDGIKYEVENDTVVSIEDEEDVSGDDSRLALGMKVKLSATEDNGMRTAKTIEFDEDLKATIESINPDSADPATGTMVVFGQTVIVDSNTVFDDDVGNNDSNPGIDFRDLQVGMSVEISGFPTEDGVLSTRIDRIVDANGQDLELGNPDNENDELELKGFVEAVAADQTSITVNGILFLVNESTLVDTDITLDDNLIGSFVEVSADFDGTNYIARKMEREDRLGEDDQGGEFEIKGVLQAINSDTTPPTITINGLILAVDSPTAFEGMVGIMLEVKGTFNEAGILLVQTIEQEEESDFKTEDTISEVDITNGTFTTRLGIIITPEGSSRLEDDVSDAGDHLTVQQFLALIVPGDLIKAEASENAEGILQWSRIRRLDASDELGDTSCSVSGPVSEITGNSSQFSFLIYTVNVGTDRILDADFRDANGLSLGRTAFFDALEPGMRVKAESYEGDAYCTPNLLDAEQVEFDPVDS